MRGARLRISGQRLAELLGLRPGVQVQSVFQDADDKRALRYSFVVTGDVLPERFELTEDCCAADASAAELVR